MQARELAVDGAFEFTPQVYSDDRGLVAVPFQEQAFADTTGHPLFPVVQVNHSMSGRGVVRGIHFTRTPPGMAKYVYCSRGRALDIVVDLRVGSPTFGRWDAVPLDPVEFRAVYFPVGVGHAFVALEDYTVMCYLISEAFITEREYAICPLDPSLGLPIPEDIEPILSERDRIGPTLAEAEAKGLLPDYATCLEIEATFKSS